MLGALLFAAIAVVSGCVPASALRAEEAVCTVVRTSEFADVESSVHDLVNRRRASFHLPRLRLDPRISEAARRHSSDMAAGRVAIGHDRFRSRITELMPCLRVRAAYENITVLRVTRSMAALMAVEEWMDSPTHRDNIFRVQDASGVGVVLGPDGYFYVTQIYLRTE